MGRSCPYGTTITAHGKSIASHGKTITSHDQTITTHDQTINSHAVLITGHTNRLDAVEPRVGALEGRAVVVEGKASAIENQIDAILDRLNPRDGSGQRGPCILASLGNRLGALENTTAATDRNVAQISANLVVEIDALKARLAQAEVNNDLYERQIRELRDEVNDLKQSRTVLLDSVVSLQQSETINKEKMEELRESARIQSTELKDVSRRIEIIVETATNREQVVSAQMQEQREAVNEMRAFLSRMTLQNRRSSREFPRNIEELAGLPN